MNKALLQRYRAGGFHSVQGWGINETLFDIFVHLNDFHMTNNLEGPLCEIGVHHGRTLILLGLMKRQHEKAVGIDLFESGQAQNLDASGKGSIEAARRNLAEHAPGVNFDLIAASSFDLTTDQRNLMQGCRFMHIDGGHFTEVVLNDIALTQSVLGLGGVIVIDDYWHSGFPEVQEAVHRYFWTSPSLKAVPFMTGINKIFLAHLSHRDLLLAHMSARLPEERRKPIRLLGHSAICIDPH
jgi:Methyltransferase domain